VRAGRWRLGWPRLWRAAGGEAARLARLVPNAPHAGEQDEVFLVPLADLTVRVNSG